MTWLGDDFTGINPNLDTDVAGTGQGRAFAVINIGTEGLGRDLALFVFFAAANFGTIDTASEGDFDAFGAGGHDFLDRLIDGPAGRITVLQLVGQSFGNKSGGKFRLRPLTLGGVV